MVIIFDIEQWKKMLNRLVDIAADTKDPEVAISCLEEYDLARKRLDRVQAYPQYGARSEIERYKS